MRSVLVGAWRRKNKNLASHNNCLSLDATTVSTSDGSSLQQDESIAEPGTILEEPRHLVDIKQSREMHVGSKTPSIVVQRKLLKV
ncbi:hypothetical protein Bca52824_017147 [Brassica carinata]|uniref:Uncharacterized protein n=1 Tax=Brassica carinata TaxID=52824 RepID=A0A8X7VNH8_BRACI|nr:hypothetical protein Bca52824_017147 [Brassica carinata]